MTSLYAALELGTTRTVLAIGEVETGGRLKIVCHAEIPSSGIRKSQILDIHHVTQSIRSVLRASEDKQKSAGVPISIGNAFLVVSGQHIKADSFQGSAQVGGAKVNAEDINEVIRSAHTMTLPKDRELLEIVDQCYELDRLSGIQSPKGMSGRILKLNTLQIHADANRINDARSAAENAHLEIRDPLFAVTCAADAVLSDYDRREGVLVLDLGGGSTGFAVYSDGFPVHAGVIGVGGDHITNDIAHAFQTTQAQAEELKTQEACAIIGGKPGDARVKILGSSPLIESRTISRRALDIVVNARLKETFQIIRQRLEDLDLLHRLHAGIVITGGGAALCGLDNLLQRELGMSVKVGKPVNIDGLEKEAHPESFAAVAGALLYAHRNYEEKSIFSILGGLFK